MYSRFNRRPTRNVIGSNLISNGKTFDREIKIVNAVTGVVSNSLSEELRRKKLMESGIPNEIMNMKDPYIELLEGINEMGEYFPTRSYNVITSGKALLTLDEIKSGYYLDDNSYFYSSNDVFTFTNEVRTYLPLLEIVRLLSLNHNVSLVNKKDLLPMYREIEKIVYMTDEENYPSYNKLPYNKDVVLELRRLKESIETEDPWIFYVEEPKDIVFGEKNLGNLLSLARDIDNYQNASRESSAKELEKQQDVSIQEILKYKKRT